MILKKVKQRKQYQRKKGEAGIRVGEYPALNIAATINNSKLEK